MAEQSDKIKIPRSTAALFMGVESPKYKALMNILGFDEAMVNATLNEWTALNKQNGATVYEKIGFYEPKTVKHPCRGVFSDEVLEVYWCLGVPYEAAPAGGVALPEHKDCDRNCVVESPINLRFRESYPDDVPFMVRRLLMLTQYDRPKDELQYTTGDRGWVLVRRPTAILLRQ